MAMFFHTKQRSEKNSKRQSKNKLPKLSAIDPQVKDFFPFKIRPDSAKTGNSKTSNSKLDTTDSSKFDDTSSSVTTSTVTMTTKSRRLLSSGTHQNNFRYLSGTKTHNNPQASPSTPKLTTKSNPRIFISEDPKLRALSENVKPLREVRRKEGVCIRGSPETLSGRDSTERVCRPERQILYRHRAPYYEEYCKKNFPRSLTNVR